MKYDKLIFIYCIILFFACRNESNSWKIPIGYRTHNISLGDSFSQINKKIGALKFDVNADNNDIFKNYFVIEKKTIELENLTLNPICSLRFKNDKLVRFEVVYTINEPKKTIDFENLIKKIGLKELTQIEGLINKKKKSIANNKELWLRRIDIDSISGEYPKIRYRVQVIP